MLRHSFNVFLFFLIPFLNGVLAVQDGPITYAIGTLAPPDLLKKHGSFNEYLVNEMPADHQGKRFVRVHVNGPSLQKYYNEHHHDENYFVYEVDTNDSEFKREFLGFKWDKEELGNNKPFHNYYYKAAEVAGWIPIRWESVDNILTSGPNVGLRSVKKENYH